LPPLVFSNNFGASWYAVLPQYYISSSQPCGTVAISANGRYVFTQATNDGTLVVSSDFGQSWATRSTNIILPVFTSVFASANEQVFYGATVVTSSANITQLFVWKSADYGATWNSSSGLVANVDTSLFSISLSLTGQYMLTTLNGLIAFTSSNFGVNWTQCSLPSNTAYLTTGMSLDGKYQFIGTTPSSSDGSVPPPSIYSSTNYGLTFSILPASPRYAFFLFICSGTGQVLSAHNNHQNNTWQDTNEYLSFNYGANWSVTSTTIYNVYSMVMNQISPVLWS
jgi:hypothetical protein